MKRPEGRSSVRRPQSSVAGSEAQRGSSRQRTTQQAVSTLGSLLEDISKLDNRFCAVMDDPRRIDRVRGMWGAHSPYLDFAPKVQSLVTRCRLAFDLGELDLARDAYAALFSMLMRKDSYGFPVARPKEVDFREEYTRYLRAEIESNPPDQQAIKLFEAWRKLRVGLWDADKLTIRSILQSRSAPLDTRDALLDGLIPLVHQGKDIEDDRWLREAVKIRRGKQGLVELARNEGDRRPWAWLNWLELVATEEDPSRLLSAAKEALAGIPDGLSLRAQAADYWFQAAKALGDQRQAVEARWEAFRAAPIPRRLLDLRDAAGETRAQRWLKRALSYGLTGGLALVAGPQVGYTGNANDRVFLEKGDGYYDDCGPAVIGCIRLLLGSWRTALADARKESMMAWDENIQGLILPVLLAWLTGWPANSPPATVAALFEEAFGRMDGSNDEGSCTGTRFRQALADSMSRWEAPAEGGRSKVISQFIRLAIAQVDLVVDRHYSGAYVSAARLVKAAEEVLSLDASESSGRELLDGLIARQKGNPEFATILAAALGPPR